MRAYTPDEIETLSRVNPLVSAWGTAMEEGYDDRPHLLALITLRDKEPEALQLSLDFAEYFQTLMNDGDASLENVHEHAPSHPAQRLLRVKTLKSYLSMP